jgi:tRNA threonylcarbamoyladenosine biosynthesis protein TsaB
VCHSGKVMPVDSSPLARQKASAEFVLGVDTCGPSGSVALGRIFGESVRILGQKELAGRSYSATLITAVGELLAECGATLKDLRAIVVVFGPGSFTGVRVGLSAVKGLAEPGGIPVVPVSRLGVLAWKARVRSAALDAHRREVFLRLDGEHAAPREMLAGVEELNAIEIMPGRIAVCDDGAAALLGGGWQRVDLVRVDAPTAANAIEFAVKPIVDGQFVDLALLDGHYLRRSDAEIFGEPARVSLKADSARTQAMLVRVMREPDIEQAMQIAASEWDAPQWARSAYQAALNPVAQRRLALVAEDAATGTMAGFAILSINPPEAELESIVTAAEYQRRGVARRLFNSLACELRHAGGDRVILEVRESNRRARALYTSLGFTESGRRPRYYADPAEDAVLMRLDLCDREQGHRRGFSKSEV